MNYRNDRQYDIDKYKQKPMMAFLAKYLQAKTNDGPHCKSQQGHHMPGDPTDRQKRKTTALVNR